MGRPREYDDDLRIRLVETAGRLLVAGGPEAVTLRRVAGECGTSTNAIYTLIGSKQELVRAMYWEGFRRLGDYLEAVPPDEDPVGRLTALGAAYFEMAIENPHLYTVMLSNPVPEFRPTEEDALFAYSKLRIIIDAIEGCIAAGILAGPSNEIASALWAVPHGIVTLANVGMIASTDRNHARMLHENLMRAAILGLSSGTYEWPTHPDPASPHRTARVVADASGTAQVADA